MHWLVNQIACNSSIDCVVIFVIKYFLPLHVTGIYQCITKVIWKSLLWQGGNIKREEFYFKCVIHTGMGEDKAENPPYKQSEEKANLEKLLILDVIKSKISRKSGWWGGDFLTSYPNSFFRTYIYSLNPRQNSSLIDIFIVLICKFTS